MSKCRFVVKVFMMAISLAEDAPTRWTDFCAQSSAMSCQLVRGELSREVKWPLTPMEAQVSSWASMWDRTALGCAPRELPTR